MNTPRLAEGLAYVPRASRVVVLNLPRIGQQQSPYVFEGTAFEIWRRINGARTETQIVDELTGLSGFERKAVARDTSAFLATLLSLGLVVDSEAEERL